MSHTRLWIALYTVRQLHFTALDTIPRVNSKKKWEPDQSAFFCFFTIQLANRLILFRDQFLNDPWLRSIRCFRIVSMKSIFTPRRSYYWSFKSVRFSFAIENINLYIKKMILSRSFKKICLPRNIKNSKITFSTSSLSQIFNIKNIYDNCLMNFPF